MKNNSVNPIPDGYHTLTTFIIAIKAAQLIEFLKNAFDAMEHNSHKLPDGTVVHADLQIGDSRLMLAEGSEKYPAMPAMVYLYTADVDDFYKRALTAGGTSLREPANEFYGDRTCGVMDISGNQWWIATHVEDVTPEELKRRQDEFMNAAH